MEDFEEWLVRSILRYHQQLHTGLYMSPARKWQLGFFGNRELNPLVSIPPRPADPLTVQLDFMPSFRRTIQAYGVQIDVFYYSEALRHWINTKDPETGLARKFVFRRDPRDISVVWFYDPVLKQYFRVPVAYQAFPAATLWEFKAAKRKAVSDGRANVDDALIAKLILENRELVERAAVNTKTARRAAQRAKVHSKNSTPAAPQKVATVALVSAPSEDGLLLDDIDLIGDIQ